MKNIKNLQRLVANLPWGHNLLLIEKFKDKEIRRLYAEATLENGWSRNVLSFQIDEKYHLELEIVLTILVKHYLVLIVI